MDKKKKYNNKVDKKNYDFKTDKNYYNNMWLIAIVAIVAIVGMIVMSSNKVVDVVTSGENSAGMAYSKNLNKVGVGIDAGDQCSSIFGTCGSNEPNCDDILGGSNTCCRDGKVVSAACTVSLT